MRPMPVKVPLEIEELPLQISGRPEQGAVQTFAPNGADQPFNERMRERHVRHNLDLFHVEDPQIRTGGREGYFQALDARNGGRRVWAHRSSAVRSPTRSTATSTSPPSRACPCASSDSESDRGSDCRAGDHRASELTGRGPRQTAKVPRFFL